MTLSAVITSCMTVTLLGHDLESSRKSLDDGDCKISGICFWGRFLMRTWFTLSLHLSCAAIRRYPTAGFETALAEIP